MFVRLILTAIFISTASLAMNDGASSETAGSADQIESSADANACTHCVNEKQTGCNCVCHRTKVTSLEQNEISLDALDSKVCDKCIVDTCGDACDCICHYSIVLIDPRTVPGALLTPERWKEE